MSVMVVEVIVVVGEWWYGRWMSDDSDNGGSGISALVAQ